MATRFECYYGGSGTHKSSAVATIIKDLFINTGRVSRVFIGDGSMATYEDTGLIDAGAVYAFDYSGHDFPISTLEQLAEGMLPVDKDDPSCKFLPAEKTPDFGNLGLTCFEGLSVAGDYIMGDRQGGLANRSSKGERLGGEAAIQIVDAVLDGNGKVLSGSGRTYGGLTKGAYGAGQKRLNGIVERSKMLPGWVIWTAHERLSDESNPKVIGPGGVGKSFTPNFPRMFGNTLHFVVAERKNEKKLDAHTGTQATVIGNSHRIYTTKHYLPDVFVPYLATTRIAHPDMMPAFLESDKVGAAITEFYSLIEKSKLKARAELTPNAA